MRTILHVDCNNFYASVECLYHPELRGRPVAVCGNQESRHGIVLAKNDLAKAAGIRTGDPVWMAQQRCPDLVIVPPHYDLYVKFSELARAVYADYTDRVEPFGLDECWLDVSGEDSGILADRLRERIKAELGITVSIGVSFNKVFAKLGSDLQKPDAVTFIPEGCWQKIVWPLPVESLLYVGPATAKALHRCGIRTIGGLAGASPDFIGRRFGKCGTVLQAYAQGLDRSAVAPVGTPPRILSVGNSTTMPRDMVDGDDLRIILYILSESVGQRLRELGLQCRTVQVSLRGTDLAWYERQAPLTYPSCSSQTLFNTAYALYKANTQGALRSIGVRACRLDHWSHIQTSLFDDADRAQRLDRLDSAVDDIRRRFGYASVRRGILLTAPELAAFNPQADHPLMIAGSIR